MEYRNCHILYSIDLCQILFCLNPLLGVEGRVWSSFSLIFQCIEYNLLVYYETKKSRINDINE